MKRYIYVLIIALIISACGSSDIAIVNGTGISQAQFDAYLKHKRIAIRNEEHKNRILDQYLERIALTDIIEQQAFENDELIAAELAELKKEIYISRYFEKYLSESVSDQAVNNYYNSNISDYEEKKVHVAHILLRTNRSMDESQRKVQLTTIQEAYSKIESGEDFSDIAKKYSEDAVSAKKGGDLGWVKEGSIDKAFSEKVFTMKAGDVSQPFETSFGYHVVTIIEEPKVIRKPFESAKGEIRYQLRNQYKDTEMKRLMAETEISKK